MLVVWGVWFERWVDHAKGEGHPRRQRGDDLPLKPSERVYPDHRANCLYYFNKTCKTCASVVRPERLQKKATIKIDATNIPFRHRSKKKEEYGVEIAGCGLCQTKVPCEFEIPKLIQKRYRLGSPDRRMDKD